MRTKVPAPDRDEIGMRVLREELGLIPVEYPTTRQSGATRQERSTDLMAAFADPTIRAVLATIGGADHTSRTWLGMAQR